MVQPWLITRWISWELSSPEVRAYRCSVAIIGNDKKQPWDQHRCPPNHHHHWEGTGGGKELNSQMNSHWSSSPWTLRETRIPASPDAEECRPVSKGLVSRRKKTQVVPQILTEALNIRSKPLTWKDYILK